MSIYSISDVFNICPDCIAKLVEYHMDLCDIEQCQKCGGQLLSCDCIKGMCYIEETEQE